MNDSNMIKCEDIRFNYGKNKVLRGVGFVEEPGKITGIEGRNGSGKTTFLKILTGLLKAKGGQLTFDGKMVDRLLPCSGIIENPSFWNNMSGRDNLRFYLREDYDEERVDDCLARFDLLTAVEKKTGGYSMGMRQKLAIIMSICANTPVLLLDEPTNGLDTKSIDVFFEILGEEKAKGRTIVLVTHVEAHMHKYCDTIYRLEDGVLTPLHRSALKSKMFTLTFETEAGASEAASCFEKRQIVEINGNELTVALESSEVADAVTKTSGYRLIGVKECEKLYGGAER